MLRNAVSNAQATKPAITRRYQMMNRSTYQQSMGQWSKAHAQICRTQKTR
jgi:hypothetical protein